MTTTADAHTHGDETTTNDNNLSASAGTQAHEVGTLLTKRLKGSPRVNLCKRGSQRYNLAEGGAEATRGAHASSFAAAPQCMAELASEHLWAGSFQLVAQPAARLAAQHAAQPTA